MEMVSLVARLLNESRLTPRTGLAVQIGGNWRGVNYDAVSVTMPTTEDRAFAAERHTKVTP
jgi:hypothetical protein